MTLWKWLGVDMPANDGRAGHAKEGRPRYILVWGGSTVTGQFMIQLARHSGLMVVAVTSKKTAPLAEQLGAQYVVTRDAKSNEDIVADIRAITSDSLTLAVDIVGKTSGSYCLKALSNTLPSTLAPLAFLEDHEIVPENIMIAPVEMKRFIIESGNLKYAECLNHMVECGLIRFPDRELMQGLTSVQGGLDVLKKGDMNGRKLVVKVARPID
jgi:NADPH-dependent curcumin reductase CurA